MNSIRHQELYYRLYFAKATDITGEFTSGMHTAYFAFYATDDISAWDICVNHIDSRSREVNPLNGLYRFRDNRTLELISRKPHRPRSYDFAKKNTDQSPDPKIDLIRIADLSRLQELLDLPVTKTCTRKTVTIEIS